MTLALTIRLMKLLRHAVSRCELLSNVVDEVS